MSRTLRLRHPRIRSGNQLTIGERAADRMRDSFGSWRFIGATLVFIGLWIVAVHLGADIDNHQLTILNLVLSCFAALQGAIILLAAKRADAVSSELAMHTFTDGEELLALNKQQMEILSRLNGLSDDVAGLGEAVRAARPSEQSIADAVTKALAVAARSSRTRAATRKDTT